MASSRSDGCTPDNLPAGSAAPRCHTVAITKIHSPGRAACIAEI